ncbi:MAG: carboxylesterase family protein, partial [Pseudomonadota bacterium]
MNIIVKSSLILAASTLLWGCEQPPQNTSESSTAEAPPAETASVQAQSAPAQLPETISVSGGQARGMRIGDDQAILTFKGIPYAAPPIGEQRWAPPQPVAAWEGVKDTQKFSPDCLQAPSVEGFYSPAETEQSEDCLYLNVWTGAKTADENRPVMVWIHGGAFIQGSGSNSRYDGEQFARSGVVLVTINYRLGLTGFFAHPALTAASPNKASGNYGLLDQIAALQWIKENIKAFGGDPNNVTIFGESAGSISVCYMVTTPLAKGLFHKAIGQSGGCFARHASLTSAEGVIVDTGLANQMNESGHAIGLRLAETLGVSGEEPAALEALRAMDAKEMVRKLHEAKVMAPWRSIFVDGYVYPDQMRTLYTSGQCSQVDSIVGSTSEEGSTLWMTLPEMDFAAWQESVTQTKGRHAE